MLSTSQPCISGTDATPLNTSSTVPPSTEQKASDIQEVVPYNSLSLEDLVKQGFEKIIGRMDEQDLRLAATERAVGRKRPLSEVDALVGTSHRVRAGISQSDEENVSYTRSSFQNTKVRSQLLTKL